MASLEIRPATAADREAWIAMRHELWPHCSLERHQLEIDELLAGAGVVALAWLGESAIGFAEISIRSDHVSGTSTVPVPYLEGWYVRADQRSAGVGRALINFVEAWSKSRGFIELASDAELDNTLSIALHSKLGFREVERTVHFVKSLQQNRS